MIHKNRYRLALIPPMVLALAATSLAQWSKVYNGSGNGEDYGSSIAVDASNNLIVAGTATGATGHDFILIKYNAAGTQLWIRKFDDVIGGEDILANMCVDPSGNIYVTGSSEGSGTGFDYLTIKYDPSGTVLWKKRYNAWPNKDDQPASVKVDSSGNVFVTGTAFLGSNYSYLTIKYDSAGTKLWQKIYDGPGHGDDFATSMVLDLDGNAYVTGGSAGSGTGLDYATIKYSPSGVKLWTRRYDGSDHFDDKATALAFDSSGFIVVTGDSLAIDSMDMATIRYATDGAVQWTKRYNGPSVLPKDNDFANAIAVDASGNAYVVGTSGNDVESMDFITIKYDSAGNRLWVKKISGHANTDGGSDDGANGVAIGPTGNVFVTGYIQGHDPSVTPYIYTTAQYTPGGALVWVKYVELAPNTYSKSNAIAVDAAGNAYTTGFMDNSSGNLDVLTVRH